jgi:hypothetical protein
MKSKKIKHYLFREIKANPEKVELAVLVLICLLVFVISFLAIGKPLLDYVQKKEKSVLDSQQRMELMTSAIAAENQNEENAMADQEKEMLGEKDMAESTAEADKLAKEKADKEARAKAMARQRAAERARMNSAPVLAGRTHRDANGMRVCPVKSLHPQRGGETHMDEDCCADYNEYPNPRCYYPPEKMKILKKK